jgi:hypothetical protein
MESILNVLKVLHICLCERNDSLNRQVELRFSRKLWNNMHVHKTLQHTHTHTHTHTHNTPSIASPYSPVELATALHQYGPLYIRSYAWYLCVRGNMYALTFSK